MTNKTYDTIKTIALIAAPVAVLASSILKIWNVPYTAEITATLAAVDTFLGALVAVLKAKYDKAGDTE